MGFALIAVAKRGPGLRVGLILFPLKRGTPILMRGTGYPDSSQFIISGGFRTPPKIS